MRKQAGFTFVELVITIVALVAVGGIVWSQKQALDATHRDTSRRVAINAIYYDLEEVVYPTISGYPRVLRVAQLKAIDTKLLTDPSGKQIGDPESNYRYEPTDCNGTNVCLHYTLRTTLEREADFVKQSQR